MHVCLTGEIDAIFLDRDGVINRERADYVKNWEEFEFLPGAQLALRRLAQHSWPIVVITNQSVIGRKLVQASEVAAIHDRLALEAKRCGGRLDGFFVCDHHPDECCDCRKPKPGLLYQAARAFRLNLAKCVFIGDSMTDYGAAQAAGCQALLVNSGRRELARQPSWTPAIPTLPDLLTAVEVVLSTCPRQGEVVT